jgi:N-acetylglucosamine repressor
MLPYKVHLRLKGKQIMKKISDHGKMKLNNLLKILRAIHDLGAVTRVDLQHKTHLSWGTITSATNDLLENGIIKEIGSINTGVGRRPVKLDMNIDKNFIIGLRLSSGAIRAVLMDIKGKELDEDSIDINAHTEKSSLVKQLIMVARKIIARNSLEPNNLAGIGIAVPGAVDFNSGLCLYDPHHPHWKNVPLKTIFEEEFHIPCFVDHVSNCFALSELLLGHGRGIENFISVLLGTGISAGIVINGHIYRGVNCSSGEFGHINVSRGGEKCACGNSGCLEAYVSGPALVRQGNLFTRKNKNSKIWELANADPLNISAKTIYHAATQGDKDALQIFKEMGTRLGIGLSNLINLFNPDCIILGGRIALANEFFFPDLIKTVNELAWHASVKNIKISNQENGPVLGAAAIVLQEIFNSGFILNQGNRPAG